ncbi:hypothetical protein BU17DRAFT_102028 [Hysterangium stoloniferum]|nr:hypothetical protein BU17DRAFT_102028 [Hysterangium stoloniferum]
MIEYDIFMVSHRQDLENGDNLVTRTAFIDLLDGLKDNYNAYPPESLRKLSSFQFSSTWQAFKHISLIINFAHNSRLPVNNVVDDILYTIFLMSVTEHPYPARQSLNISHVCRHWRQHALAFPALWGYMDPELPHISKLFLGRSALAPITLFNSHWDSPFFDPGHNLVPDLLSYHWRKHMPMIVDILPRLKSLVFHREKPCVDYFICAIKKMPIRVQLHDLDINICSYERTADDIGDLAKVLIPADNHLKSLSLTRIQLPWNGVSVRQLTRLSLKSLLPSPTLIQLLSILKACPDLEELEISDLSDPEELDTTHKMQVPLNRLRKLRYCAYDTPGLRYLFGMSRSIQATNLRSIEITSDEHLFFPESALHPLLLIPQGNDAFLRSLKHLHIRCRPLVPTLCYFIAGRVQSDGPSIASMRGRGYSFHGNPENLALHISGYISPEEEIPTSNQADYPFDFGFLGNFLKLTPNVQRLELESGFPNYLTPLSDIEISSTITNLSALEIHEACADPQGHDVHWLHSLTSPRVIHIDSLVLHSILFQPEGLLTLIPVLGIKSIDIRFCPWFTSEILGSLTDLGVQVFWSEVMTSRERRVRWGSAD